MKYRVIGASHSQYPSLLTEICDPPERLFVGGKPLDQSPSVAIVGTRKASPYGLEAAGWLAAELARAGLTIVSGLAQGIDAAAHRGALEAGGSTIGVLGCGIDVCYPRRNEPLFEKIEKRGSLISEYPPGSPPLPHNFPVRNRIIAGMTMATVIIEARQKGGAMITARLAMESGRDVFAMPGPVHSPGSFGAHSLIRDGARLVTSAADVLEDLGMLCLNSGDVPLPKLTPDERLAMDCLDAHPVLLDHLARRAHLPCSTLAALLAALEIKGLVSRHPGGRFAITVETGRKAGIAADRAAFS